jgi:hypothetical protein
LHVCIALHPLGPLEDEPVPYPVKHVLCGFYTASKAMYSEMYLKGNPQSSQIYTRDTEEFEHHLAGDTSEHRYDNKQFLYHLLDSTDMSHDTA